MKVDYSKIPNGATIIFKAIVGSRAFGTAVEGSSDTDIKGVYAQCSDDILGFNYQEHVQVGKDETYYEIKRYLELLRAGNPTVVELLFSPEDCVLVSEPEFEVVLSNRSKFITRRCIRTFGEYAISQFVKAKTDNRHRKLKNLLHCRRLLDMSVEIAETGMINIRRPNTEELLSIKRGEIPVDEIIAKAEKDHGRIAGLFEKSLLPNFVDAGLCNELLLKIRHSGDEKK
jgi:predicted nucleotidyltransferase